MPPVSGSKDMPAVSSIPQIADKTLTIQWLLLAGAEKKVLEDNTTSSKTVGVNNGVKKVTLELLPPSEGGESVVFKPLESTQKPIDDFISCNIYQ